MKSLWLRVTPRCDLRSTCVTGSSKTSENPSPLMWCTHGKQKRRLLTGAEGGDFFWLQKLFTCTSSHVLPPSHTTPSAHAGSLSGFLETVCAKACWVLLPLSLTLWVITCGSAKPCFSFNATPEYKTYSETKYTTTLWVWSKQETHIAHMYRLKWGLWERTKTITWFYTLLTSTWI